MIPRRKKRYEAIHKLMHDKKKGLKGDNCMLSLRANGTMERVMRCNGCVRSLGVIIYFSFSPIYLFLSLKEHDQINPSSFIHRMLDISPNWVHQYSAQ